MCTVLSHLCDCLELHTPSCTLHSASDTLNHQIPHTRLSAVGSHIFSVIGPPSSLTETLFRLIQVKPQNIYFPKTIDLPCFLFHAAGFMHLKSLFAAHFVCKFCKVRMLVCKCLHACLHACVHVHVLSLYRQDFALYEYFNYCYYYFVGKRGEARDAGWKHWSLCGINA